MQNQKPPGRTARLLSKARSARGITVRDLAVKIQKRNGDPIAPSYVTDIEKGRGIPSEYVARQLAGTLGIDVDEFLKACERDRGNR